MMFIDYVGTMRGWGRGLWKAVANWYLAKSPGEAAFQSVKYRQRYNWTHRDLLRKAHPKATGALQELLARITQGTLPSHDPYADLIHAYEMAKTADTEKLLKLIGKFNLSWEMVSPEKL